MNKTKSDPAFEAAKSAIARMDKALAISTQKDSNLRDADIVRFEDAMNGLSGALLGLENSVQLEIQTACASTMATAAAQGYTITLYKSLWLPTDVSRGTSAPAFRVGKKLYPLTTSVAIDSFVAGANIAGANIAGANIAGAAVVATEEEEEADEIDPIFEENELLDIVVDEPLSTIQNETAPYLSAALIALAETAAQNANGLQAGLVTFSQNPLASSIQSTKDLFLYYTAGNYANLNVALSYISANNANLANSYKALRESIGGPDGLSGCVAQLDFFREHTDRLSGLVLEKNSPNEVTDNDSREEYINVLDQAAGNAQVIFSFDSRYFRSAKYLVQATGGGLDRGHQTTELVILHDNYHPYTRETASVYSQDPFITFTTRLLNNRVEVLANTSVSNTDFVIYGIRLRISRAAETYSQLSQKAIIEQHELLQAYKNDGVDYVILMSGSLIAGGGLVGTLGREFSDMLANFSSAAFSSLSLAQQDAALLALASTIKTRRAAIQTQMAADWAKFVELRKLTEALDIAYNLAVSYTDSTSHTIAAATLNSSTIAAIEEKEQ